MRMPADGIASHTGADRLIFAHKMYYNCLKAISKGTLIASALFGVLAVSIGYQMTFCVFGGLTTFGFIGACTIKGVK